MKQALHPIMFVGTCSDAGKSIINAAFCRILKQDGFSPAPFKAQNMSLNSYATPEGGEMGRAQVVQAEACGIEPHTDMNPVLLKPTNNTSSQVILNGRPIGNLSAKNYFGKENKQAALFPEVIKAFKRLEKNYNPIVLEGAGSISEINLRHRDITNMRMAVAIQADTYLVADIDRGGVFGSVYGSIALLTPEEKKRIKGIIINKFRGDVSLFEQGKEMIKELTGIPVVGVIPWFQDIQIESEDSVILDKKKNSHKENHINVAIILLKRMSNFTDFDVLDTDPRFNAYYTNNPEEIELADIIIIPGSKNTITDLQDLKKKNITTAILKAYKKGKKIIGICGGYQMMGIKIEDPLKIESSLEEITGLGLLPIKTILDKEKITQQNNFKFLPTNTSNCKGYQIHQGHSSLCEPTQSAPIAQLNESNLEDGYWLNDNCWGTYLHGILDNSSVLNFLAKDYDISTSKKELSYQEFKEEQYNKLANLVRKNIDLDFIYNNLCTGATE